MVKKITFLAKIITLILIGCTFSYAIDLNIVPLKKPILKKEIKEEKISKSQPISIVASNSKRFNSNWKYFRQPIRRWLISSSKFDNSSNNDFEKQLYFEDSWKKTLISIKKQGINDLALLGGAKLINSFIKEDLITDIKITIIPRIIGGKYTWIPPEKSNEIFNLKRLWKIKSIKNLINNEIHIHYKKIEIN